MQERPDIPCNTSRTASEAADARLEESRAVPRGLTEVRHHDGIYQWLNREQVDRREQQRQQPRRAQRYRTQREIAAAAGALILVFVIAGIFIQSRVREATSLIALGAPADEAEPWAAAAGAGPAGLQQLRTSAEAEIETAVRSWAGAFTNRDAAHYLSFYSERFDLPAGMSRPSWESFRRDRLARGGEAKVTLGRLETSIRGPRSAVTRFVETFRTPYSVDRVEKTLELVKESGRWRILAERSEPLSLASSPSSAAGEPVP